MYKPGNLMELINRKTQTIGTIDHLLVKMLFSYDEGRCMKSTGEKMARWGKTGGYCSGRGLTDNDMAVPNVGIVPLNLRHPSVYPHKSRKGGKLNSKKKKI